jgi:hypothetical protein
MIASPTRHFAALFIANEAFFVPSDIMSDKLLKSALWYARHGWHVIPLHTPIMEAGACVGCSCEAWKRENLRDRFGNLQSDYTCPTPGKHPRHGAWEEVATTDVAQIAKWWRAWPTANIGIAAGKSGLVCLDADTYKSGGGEWDRAWGETVTSLTGGGGEHLIYQHPEGDPLGGSSKGLPKFIDVRAHGGQFVAPPSLHPSGNAYQWEDGYGPHQIAAAPLPEAIAAILRTAVVTQAAEFGTAVDAPDLEAWADKLPGLALAILTDDRSKIDFWLVRSLVKAGASAEEIKAVWDRRDPTGKYSEKNGHGPDYLGRTIAAATEHIGTRRLPELQAQKVAA